MTDKPQRPTDAPSGAGVGERHPILSGLVALVAVVLVVSAVVGGAALVASKSLGLSADGAIDTGQSAKETLFLPPPSETDDPDAPYLTLPAQPQTPTDAPTKKRRKSPEPVQAITLSAGQTAVAPMQQIDLTGTYPTGEGAVLRVQRFEGGAWTDFPVTASVSGGGFSTYIQTGSTGLNRFRVIDTDTGATSNEIKVQVG